MSKISNEDRLKSENLCLYQTVEKLRKDLTTAKKEFEDCLKDSMAIAQRCLKVEAKLADAALIEGDLQAVIVAKKDFLKVTVQKNKRLLEEVVQLQAELIEQAEHIKLLQDCDDTSLTSIDNLCIEIEQLKTDLIWAYNRGYVKGLAEGRE